MLKQRIFIDVFRIDNNCVEILLILIFNPSSMTYSMGDHSATKLPMLCQDITQERTGACIV